MRKLRFRQVHLDFHTSPAIEGIGEAFDAANFQETLKAANVDSITAFAVCHHGWSYYNTQVGERHPHLKFDLLRAQFEACKEIDINVPIYVTAGVNNRVAEEHPEWRIVSPKGNYGGWTTSPLDPGFKTLCLNSPYLDLLCENIREVARLYPNCDGIFTDIIAQPQCCCKYCLNDMKKEGYDPDSEEDRIRFSRRTLLKYYRESTAAAKEADPNMPIFHNSGHIKRGDSEVLEYFDHLEIESLPTGGWGYDDFPLSAKYCERLPHDFLGMTGKFHSTWGEFGGIKHPNALRYECSAMLAFGSKCSVGDQLHPNGRIDETTYRVIGQAYTEVAQKEAWCEGVENVADIAILSSTSLCAHRAPDASDVGAGRTLLEEHFLFTLIDAEMDFSPYRLLILPDNISISPELKTKLDTYLAGGGKLMLTGKSGVSEDGNSFLFDTGATIEGLSPYSPDYLMPEADFRPDFVSTPVVAYTPSYRIKVTDGTSLGKIHDPYFNRSWEHFCSHQHTPYQPETSGYDCGSLKGKVLYLAHPVFTLYRGMGAVVYRDYIARSIRRLLAEDESLKVNMPSTARLSLQHQPKDNRYVLHLLYANTILRGGAVTLQGGNMVGRAKGTEVIEDLLPLTGTEVEINLPIEVRKIKLEPQGESLNFERTEKGVRFKVDSFTCHQMVVLS